MNPAAPTDWDAGQQERNARVVAAHASGDLPLLIRLYTEAAEWFETRGAIDEACFFLTQAHVLALAEGDPRRAALHGKLCARGREE